MRIMGAREGFAHWELNPRAIHALCSILYGALFLGNVRGCDDRHSHALNTRVFFVLSSRPPSVRKQQLNPGAVSDIL